MLRWSTGANGLGHAEFFSTGPDNARVHWLRCHDAHIRIEDKLQAAGLEVRLSYGDKIDLNGSVMYFMLEESAAHAPKPGVLLLPATRLHTSVPLLLRSSLVFD